MPLLVIGRPTNAWAQTILNALKIGPPPRRRVLVLANPLVQILNSKLGWLLRYKVIWLGGIEPPRPWEKLLLKLAAIFCHAIIAPNQGSEIIYLRMGITNTKLNLVYPPVQFKESLHKKTETLTLGCEATVDIDAGLGTLLRAVVLARDILGRLKLVLACTGASRAKIEWSARQMGLNGSVQIADSGRLAWLDPVNVYILPGVSAGPAPFSLWPAMALGQAVIGINKPENKEFIEDEERGLLVEPANAEALSQAIIRLAREENLRLHLGQNNRAFTQARGGEKVFRAQLEKILG